MACNVQLSKALVKLLRHDAMTRGLHLTKEGYANVDDILELSFFNSFDEDDIERLVDRDNKGRFAKRRNGGQLQVKATQGHSIRLSDPELEPITHSSQARVVLHGTRRRNIDSIRQRGISRMNRDHIHFAPAEHGAMSGMPAKCEMAIEIDIEKALRDRIKFYKSENGVILSPGDRNGCIPTKYFKKAYDLKTSKSSIMACTKS
ncbi:tRNA 2'-phosphotransferase 1-like isoform X1 [Mytilus edulis]|uniref:tRNA 2'-phosphotransferase 1-like isoform X1 n=1 Tax=Mytilus edulis TaxID=6550 RepID=UPI0039EFA5E1